jgi:hypothetical protein
VAAGAREFTNPSPPPGGISRAAAITAAEAHVDPGSAAVTSAEIRRNFSLGLSGRQRPWVWVVTFTGRWALICTGNCTRTTEWVAVDYFTGRWLASEFTYPEA